MRGRIVTLALLAAMVSTTATAQTMCRERDEFVTQLNKGFSEAPVAMGLAANGSVVEVLASDSGSWTIMITMPNGVSCVVATGESWQDVEKVAMGPNT